MTNNEAVTVSLNLTERQAHLLSIVCGLNVTVPQAATERSELLQSEQRSSPESEVRLTQRMEVRRALMALRESLQQATPSCLMAKTTEITTSHPEGLI